jgi:DNA mismatch endonuclease (patch repair protein)
MTDVFDAEKRSRIMAAIRSKHTGPEVRFAAFLRAHGVRFRRHVRGLPGSPDFVLAAHRVAIFVHGCFWHGHAACGKAARLPKTRRAFWKAKIERNRARDARDVRRLRARGWSVLTFWECGLRRDPAPARLFRKIGAYPPRRPPRAPAANRAV